MTKKNLNREIKDAAAPAIEVVRLLVEQMRQQRQSDAEILAALDRLERDNPAKVDADVIAMVMREIRKSMLLKEETLLRTDPGRGVDLCCRTAPDFGDWTTTVNFDQFTAAQPIGLAGRISAAQVARNCISKKGAT